MKMDLGGPITSASRPTFDTPGASPAEAARVPRVSDDLLDTWIYIVSNVEPEDDPLDVRERQVLRVSLDLRDERREHADARATIADLERRLEEAREHANDMIALGLRTQVEAHEANARADALQVRLTAERERGEARWREGRDAAAEVCRNRAEEARHVADLRGSTDTMRQHARERQGAYTCVAAAIRALTPPDAPQEGETTP